jgi:hypothetical protein
VGHLLNVQTSSPPDSLNVQTCAANHLLDGQSWRALVLTDSSGSSPASGDKLVACRTRWRHKFSNNQLERS